ncbi:YidC/Oxa1 family insertase periplasmic-domain containing protein, partial [uncultured Ligilactobacillus sp.]|uniref:YidC/Oxa1 family insertase periplasmic-domain containing protein n=1 Tax=uncultured Ligilactobacillus sp. TaxID=2837633 RepID=UPI00272BFD77
KDGPCLIHECGFKNENMYTTVAYRFPGASSIEELGMSEESKSENVDEPVDWVAFKQQFFSSVFIAPQHVSHAVLKFDTERPGSGCMKRFSAAMSVPYTVQTQGYDFAFYFGPNNDRGGRHIYSTIPSNSKRCR